MELLVMLGRLGLAFLLGAVVGYEREREGKPAGLRTLILVSLGSAMFVLVTEWVVKTEGTQPDVVRIIAGIAQGIGFLGAGTIVVTHGAVYGLTTAAAIWAISAVGTACGFGAWPIALAGTIAILIALRALSWLETRMGSK